jgi:hypothetical protein
MPDAESIPYKENAWARSSRFPTDVVIKPCTPPTVNATKQANFAKGIRSKGLSKEAGRFVLIVRDEACKIVKKKSFFFSVPF